MLSPKRNLNSLREQLENALVSGRFDECYRIYREQSFEKISNELLALSWKTGDIQKLPYAFVWFLLSKKENVKLHLLGHDILFNSLNHLPHSYELGLYHARRLTELEPDNLHHKRIFLLYNHIPERVLGDNEAKQAAIEILKKEPDNKVVKEQLECIESRLKTKKK